MARPEDIGHLSMRVSYGPQWKHDAPEALQVWANALAPYNRQQIDRALASCLDHYIDFAPTLPQFLKLIRESVPLLPGSAEEDKAITDAVFAYARPQSKHNRKGNPFGVSLPDSIAQRVGGESIEAYSQRIACAVTKTIHRQSLPGDTGSHRGFLEVL